MVTQKKRRILMAEDNEDHYLLTQEAFLEAGLPVELSWVKDGEELMGFLGRDTPELVLLDLHMPKKDGKEALKEMRAQASWRDIPVIVFTSSDSQADVRDTFRLGANSYLIKPISFDRMVSMLRTLYEYWFVLSRIPAGDAQP